MCFFLDDDTAAQYIATQVFTLPNLLCWLFSVLLYLLSLDVTPLKLCLLFDICILKILCVYRCVCVCVSAGMCIFVCEGLFFGVRLINSRMCKSINATWSYIKIINDKDT